MAYVAKKLYLAMTYDAMSNPLTKTQTISTGGKSQTVNQRYGLVKAATLTR